MGKLPESHACLEGRGGFRHFHLPATGGGDTPKSREHLHTVYAQMIDANRENMEQSLKQL